SIDATGARRCNSVQLFLAILKFPFRIILIDGLSLHSISGPTDRRQGLWEMRAGMPAFSRKGLRRLPLLRRGLVAMMPTPPPHPLPKPRPLLVAHLIPALHHAGAPVPVVSAPAAPAAEQDLAQHQHAHRLPETDLVP